MPQRELELAGELYSSFRDRGVGQVRRAQMNWPAVDVAIGRVVAIEYLTTHGEKPVHYRHDFKAWARPEFTASPDGRLLLIKPGNFVFTERGIIDSRNPERRR